MNNVNIDTMPAGPEMDSLIAEKVMNGHPMSVDEMTFWSPSEGIAHAWEVVDKLKSDGYGIDLGLDSVDCWVCFTRPDGHDTGSVIATTAPLAICRAALKATT